RRASPSWPAPSAASRRWSRHRTTAASCSRRGPRTWPTASPGRSARGPGRPAPRPTPPPTAASGSTGTPTRRRPPPPSPPGRRAPAVPGGAPARPPLVSVCLAHFNRPGPLRQALRSLEAQDYPHFEVVLVDDGSNDPEALALLDELGPVFARRGWRVVRQENR